MSPHGMLDPWALKFSRWKKRAVMAISERKHLDGAIIHALSFAELDAIRALGIVSPVAVIPNGVDPAPAAALPPPDWMDRPTLLFLGRLHPKKGIAQLITAWSLVADLLPDWQLAIAGWMDGATSFSEQAAQTNGRTIFVGPLYGAAKEAAYAHACAFVLPSFSEGLPMTVLEAWAHGCPVLMTDACNLPEGFDTGAAAQISTEPITMAAVLLAHLSDEAWLVSAGAAGRRLVSERFIWDAVAEEFRALYNWALGSGPKPRTVHA